ncbi:hypothetical protein INR49_001150, partial [Caranx melampygus]
MILGLILSLAGFIYYKRKARGQTSSDQFTPDGSWFLLTEPDPEPGSGPVQSCSDSQCFPLLDWMNSWFSKPGPELSSDTQLVQTWSSTLTLSDLDSNNAGPGLIRTLMVLKQ